jgi:hypothetical protein
VCKNNIFITETAVAWHFGHAFALIRNLIYDVEGGKLCGKTAEAYQYRLDAGFTGTHKLSCECLRITQT